MTDKPPLDPTLRYYQRDAVIAAESALEQHRSTLIRMATGLGKTRVISSVIRRWPGRVLFLAHRDELLEQGRKELERATREHVELEKAQFYSFKARIVVASIQTLSRESEDWRGAKSLRRLESIQRAGPISLVVIDEAHRAVAPSYRKVLHALGPECKVLGVTATTDRLDKRAQGLVFDAPAYDMGIWEGIDTGFLVPLSLRHCKLESIDLSTVRKSRAEGGLNLHDLDEAMVKAVEHITKDTIRLEPDRQGIAFFPGVRSAQYAADRFNVLRPGSAICITGDTDPLERRALVRAFKRGEYLYLCNCQVATEGFDAPGASMVIMGRPTASRALYTQMVGRCTRPQDGLLRDWLEADDAVMRRQAIAFSDKPGGVVLDFVGVTGKHELAGPENMLEGDYTAEEVTLARKIAEEKGEAEQDPRENLEEARKRLAEVAKAIKSKIRSSVTNVTPLEVFGTKFKGHDAYGKEPASDGQQRMLVNAGIPRGEVRRLTKKQAQRLIGTVIKRRQLGLCSYNQLVKLQQFGVRKKNVSARKAKLALDYLSETGWGRETSLDRLHRIVEG